MSEAFWIALIPTTVTAAAAVLSSWLANRSRKKDDEKRDKNKAKDQKKREDLDAAFRQEVKDKLDRLDEKIEENRERLDKHNGYGEKWANSQEHLARMDERLEHIEEHSREHGDELKSIRKTIVRYHGGA